jgi:hypothetical protein
VIKYNPKDTNAYFEDLEIDLDNLHIESQHQPTRFMKYAQALANEKKEYARKKRMFRVECAGVAKNARENLGIKTEKAIQDHVDSDSNLLSIEMELIEIQRRIDVLTGAVEAFRDRRQELVNLVKMDSDGYFQRMPEKLIQRYDFERTTAEMREEVEEGEQRLKEKVRKQKQVSVGEEEVPPPEKKKRKLPRD